jgi:hypothetical protein
MSKDYFYEVVTHLKNKPEKRLSSSYDDQAMLAKNLSEKPERAKMAILNKVLVDNDGSELQVQQWTYINGKVTSENTTTFERDTTMDVDTSNFDANDSAASAKAAKAAAKELKAQERAEKKAAKEAEKAAKTQARAEALARGEKMPGVPRRSRFFDDAVITWGSKYEGTNPKREGAKAHFAFSHYQDGMTVKEYRDAIAADSQASDALGNLAWDSAREYIVISGGTAPADTDTNVE